MAAPNYPTCHPAFVYADADCAPQPTGRLAGWVIPAKDLSDVAGMPTTCGSPHRAYTATETSPFLARLVRDGAAINGKTLSSELGATIYAERPDVPVLSSPAYPGCTPGGSSTGAAVLVAEGVYRATHGSDAGGSLRVPAAACEVVGFKPSNLAPGVPTDGFITRSVADQAFLLGYTGTGVAARGGYTVGVLTTPLFTQGTDVAAERVDIIRRAADTLADLDMVSEVRELEPYPQATRTFEHFTARISHAFATQNPHDSPYLAWLTAQGSATTASELAAASAHVTHLPEILRDEWGVDVLLTPTVATDPPPLGYFPSLTPPKSFHSQTAWSPWCSLFNLTGGPAIAVGPIHIGGITVGDEVVLALGQAVEKLWREWITTRGLAPTPHQ